MYRSFCHRCAVKKNLRTPANIAKAKLLKEQGMTNTEIGLQFGVGECTIRNWVDPDAYDRHVERVKKWQKDNAELVNEREKNRRRGWNRQQKDKACERQRRYYRDNPKVKERLARLMAKYRNTAQGRIAAAVRVANLAFANRLPPTHTKFMEAMTGLTRDQFTSRFNKEGVFDHVVPVCAFDLLNPEHLVRCCYVDNVQILSRRENEIKGKTKPNGLDVMKLPWIGAEDALVQAQGFIARRLARQERYERTGE